MAAAPSYQDAWQAHQRGDTRTAEDAYRRILQAEPRNGRVWFTLGTLCADLGRLVEAVGCFRQSAELNPRDALALLHVGNTSLRMEKYAEAEAAYRACLDLQPETADALVNLGFVLGEQERYEEAVRCYETARKVAPHVPEVHHNLGNMLRELKRVPDALACYNEALRLRPTYTKALVNKGIALTATCAVEEAIGCLQRCVELQPDFAEAHNTLGHAYSTDGRIREALAEFEKAIDLKPDYPDPYWNRSLLWLLIGDFERGWPAFESRWRCVKTQPHLPRIDRPRWDGSPLNGRTILLHAEQGLGDTLHFVRYAAVVKAHGGRVIVQCQARLIPLFRRCEGIDQLVAWGEPVPNCDVWLPMMSLPAVLRTTIASIPSTIPYLFPDPAFVEHWRQELASINGFKIGIAWQGSPRHPWDRHRSTSLALFEPLARIPGVQLISLQRGFGSEQLDDRPRNFPLIQFGDQLDQGGAFTDSAAIVRNLDLVITVDSSIAHVAGALGVPTWVVIHRTPDWRWLLDRTDSPWYPSVRLFRQKKVNEWKPVFEDVAAALSTLVRNHQPNLPLLVEVSAGELIDKLTILHIKSERMSDADKLANVKKEIATLLQVRSGISASTELDELERKLKETNQNLWEIEDSIREHERRKDFGPAFIELARSVYLNNDRRAELKRQINALLKSRLIEEKSYASYTSDLPAGD